MESVRYRATTWNNGGILAFTLSARRLFTEVFPRNCASVQSYGNVLAATAFLNGLTVQELRREKLDYHDPAYEVLIGLRAVKPPAAESKK